MFTKINRFLPALNVRYDPLDTFIEQAFGWSGCTFPLEPYLQKVKFQGKGEPRPVSGVGGSIEVSPAQEKIYLKLWSICP